MQFLKDHYEKVILGVVLIGLAAMAGLLSLKIINERAALPNAATLPAPRSTPIDPIEAGQYEEAVGVLNQVPEPTLSGSHNVFNPVTWMKNPDDEMIKIDSPDKWGVNLLQITDLKPLSLRIAFDRARDAGYFFYVENEAAENPTERRRRSVFVSPGSPRTDEFTLEKVNGPEAEPVSFELLLNDSLERIAVSPGRPYEEVRGYLADLEVPGERKKFPATRERDLLRFGNDTNIVVDISSNQIVLQALSNEKIATVPYQSGQ